MTKFDWETAYLNKQISLAEALLLFLVEVDAPEFLRADLEKAVMQYQDGEAADLAEPLGMAMSKREKNAMARETWISHVRFHVDSFNEQGFPKVDPTQYDGTAFHKAAKLLCRSPSQIFDTYYGK